MSPALPPTIWTVGHSNLSIQAFIALIEARGIHGVADVRRFAGSRRHPQFSEHALRAALAERGIAYLWLPQLGGRREPSADSPNTAWREPGFRGYADHLDSAEFAVGFDRLLQFAGRQPSAVMCAERLWSQCHRQLIADVLTARGVTVIHILDAEHDEPHRLHLRAQMLDGHLCYPATPEPGQGLQGELFG
jgi:uncharacterized protein (DUF488 family)